MKVYRAAEHLAVIEAEGWWAIEGFSFDDWFRAAQPASWLGERLSSATKTEPLSADSPLLAPLESQEVWAAGVTYLRSREARREESRGAASFYDQVYEAERPELFFKATPSRAVGHLSPVGIRSDSTWSVPEPELTVAVSSSGRVFGFTIGNDMSSRSIEGENPLYLPQAKVYQRSCALGPCLLLAEEALPPDTEIALELLRDGKAVVAGSVAISRMKRSLPELVGFLFRDNVFSLGCYLMAGTGVVPPQDFTLRQGDRISITIEPIGTLVNTVG